MPRGLLTEDRIPTTVETNYKVSSKIGEVNTSMSRLAIEKRLERSLHRSRSRKRDVSVGTKTGLTHTYYMKSLKYYLSLKNKPQIGKVYCEHFLQSIAAIKYTQTLRQVSDEAIYKSQVNCPIIDEKHKNSSLDSP